MLLSTDTQRSEADVKRIFSKRFDIEGIFPTSWTHFVLDNTFLAKVFDALIAHMTIVMLLTFFLTLSLRHIHNTNNMADELCLAIKAEVLQQAFCLFSLNGQQCQRTMDFAT